MTDHRPDELRGAHLAGESLTPTERFELRSLLASNPEADQELNELRSLALALRADSGLLEGLREHLDAQATPEASSSDHAGAHTVVPIDPLRAPSQIVRQWTTALAGVAAGLAIVATVVQGRFEPTPASPSRPGATSSTPVTAEPSSRSTQVFLGDQKSGLAVGVQYIPDSDATLMIVRVGGNIPTGTKYKVGIIYSQGQSEVSKFGAALTSEAPESKDFWSSATGRREIDVRKVQSAPVGGLFRIPLNLPPDEIVVRTLNPDKELFRGNLTDAAHTVPLGLPSSPVSALTTLTTGPIGPTR